MPISKDGGIHIDHFRKKGMFHAEEFCWENFVVDERDNTLYGAGHKDRKVKTKEIYDQLLSPVLDHPEEYLTYMEYGSIIPRRTIDAVKQEKAQTTIDIFNLDHEYLTNKRRDLISVFRGCRAGGMSKDEMYRYMGNSGFYSLIDYVFEE